MLKLATETEVSAARIGLPRPPEVGPPAVAVFAALTTNPGAAANNVGALALRQHGPNHAPGLRQVPSHPTAPMPKSCTTRRVIPSVPASVKTSICGTPPVAASVAISKTGC